MVNNIYKNPDNGLENIIILLKNTTGVFDVKKINIDEYGFSRTTQFRIRDRTYKLIWYKNIMTLITPNKIRIMFHYIHNQNTWPISSKASLQLEDENYDTICFLPTLFYKNKE